MTEDDVQKLFEDYGQIVEVNIPIDPVSRKIKVCDLILESFHFSFFSHILTFL